MKPGGAEPPPLHKLLARLVEHMDLAVVEGQGEIKNPPFGRAA
jgi:hypothetical protein